MLSQKKSLTKLKDYGIIMIMERIGTDESGKGSYFGPLVAAGINVGDGEEKLLQDLGVKDSKRLSSSSIRAMSEAITANYVHSIVLVTPKRYNELYPRMRTLNGFLVWAHKTVIRNILKETDTRFVIIDDFGSARFIKPAFPKLKFEIRKSAEGDLAVAGASIIARDRFLNWFIKTRAEYGIDFTIGINDETINCGKRLVKEYGRDALSKVAKLHFKTTDMIMD